MKGEVELRGDRREFIEIVRGFKKNYLEPWLAFETLVTKCIDAGCINLDWRKICNDLFAYSLGEDSVTFYSKYGPSLKFYLGNLGNRSIMLAIG